MPHLPPPRRGGPTAAPPVRLPRQHPLRPRRLPAPVARHPPPATMRGAYIASNRLPFPPLRLGFVFPCLGVRTRPLLGRAQLCRFIPFAAELLSNLTTRCHCDARCRVKCTAFSASCMSEDDPLMLVLGPSDFHLGSVNTLQ